MKATLIYFRTLIFSTFIGSLNFIIPSLTTLYGLNFSGWAWLLVMVVSFYYLLFLVKKSFFNLKIWSFWVIILLVYLVLNFSWVGLQGTIQFFIPLLVGYVAGGLEYNKKSIAEILKYFKYLIILILFFTSVLSYIRFGFLGFGPATDAHVMAIAGVLGISFYYHTKKIKYLFYYVFASLAPILAVTRMGILIMLLIPFIHFYKLFSFRKFFLILLLIPVSIYIFNLQSVQQKMFYKGEGEIFDIDIANDDFNTSGRSVFFEEIYNEFIKSPFFGKGARSDYFLLKSKNYKINEVHNDYLQLLVSYGIFGTLIFFIALIMMFIKIQKLKIISNNEKLIQVTVLTLFFPLLMFMLTDSILRMHYSFMNYFFALIGVLMAINKQNRIIYKYNHDNNSSNPFI